jgi:O-antigen/teichoic acid export membrane protein
VGSHAPRPSATAPSSPVSRSAAGYQSRPKYPPLAGIQAIHSASSTSAGANGTAAARRPGPRRAAALRAGLGLKLAVAIPAAALLAALAGPIAAAYGLPGLVWPLRIAAVALAGQSLMLFLAGQFNAAGRLGLQLRVVVLESVSELGATIALVAAGLGLIGAMLGRAMAYGVAVLLAASLARRAIGISASRRPGIVGELVRDAAPILIVEGAFVLFTQIDVLLLSALRGPAAAGVFQAPLRLAVVLQYPGLAVANALTPRLAEPRLGPDLRRSFTRALRWLAVIGLAEGAATLALAGPLADRVLGSGYGGSATVIVCLSPYIALAVLAPLASMTVSFRGQARRRIPIAVAALAVNAAVDLALIPTLGPAAAALGTDLGIAIYVLAHLAVCCREIGVAPRELLPSAARGWRPERVGA